MGFFEAIGSFFKNYVTFSGRASRSEYWYVFLFSLLITAMIGVIGGAEERISQMLMSVFNIATFLPSLALNARRLHDVNWSAWWMVLIVPVLISAFFKGTEGENRFGADPLQKNLNPNNTHTQQQNFNPYIQK